MRVVASVNDFSNGFDEQSDIFNRKKLHELIVRVVTNAPDKSLVLALDDQWGNGKTSFVRMMGSEIELKHSDDLDIIYFDAFENDYQSDPFLALSSQIYKMLEKDQGILNKLGDNFLSAGKKVGASLLTNGAKLFISAATANIVNGTVLEKTGDAISDSLYSPLEKFIENKIKSSANEEREIVNFKNVLSDIYKETNKKIIFIIDELDRARPDFSLDLLEKIKHIFSVEGFVFLLVMNRGQFEKSIEHRYGKIDSRLYLNKFIHYWFTLPKIKQTTKQTYQTSTLVTFLNNLQSNGSNVISYGSVTMKTLAYLLEINSCSLREAERCFSVYCLIKGGDQVASYLQAYQAAFACATFLKVHNPKLLEKLAYRDISFKDALSELNLSSEKISDSDELYYLIGVLEYSLLSDEDIAGNKKDNPKIYDRFDLGEPIRRIDYFNNIHKSIEDLIIDI
ncbi:TPA: KAP family P-loop NTPase fold protein [Yersinia enterocolitica]